MRYICGFFAPEEAEVRCGRDLFFLMKDEMIKIRCRACFERFNMDWKSISEEEFEAMWIIKG